MGKKSGHHQPRIRINQRVLFYAIVAAFVMLLPEFHYVVTQSQQKMVIAKMMGLIKSASFRYQLFVAFYQSGGNIECPCVIREYIQFLGRAATCIESEGPHELTRLHGGIDEQIEGDRQK